MLTRRPATLHSLLPLVPLVVALTVLAFASRVSAQTYTNAQPINIPMVGAAAPYPSTITIPNGSPIIGSVSVTLHGYSHTFPGDVIIILAAPDGRAIHLAQRCGSATDATGGTFTFVAADLAPPITNFSGPGATFSATSCSVATAPAPAPIPTLTDLRQFLGSDSSGTWSLYVADVVSNDSGVINGWSLTISPTDISTPVPSSFSYQGRITDNTQPFNGQASLVFRLFDASTNGNLLGTSSGNVQVVDGLFTAYPGFNSAVLETDGSLWLDVTVNGATMTPRQRINPAPRTTRSKSAALADSANTLVSNALVNGPVGFGAAPLASSKLLAHQTSVSATQWHIELTNASAPSFRGGIRLNNDGFLEISNLATLQFGLFARLSSTGAWTVSSDARLKTDIRPAGGMLDCALKLRPVYFHWLNGDESRGTAGEDFGLIAQEAREVLPRLVTGDEAKETLTVNYSQLSVVAIGAIQELKAKHDAELAATQAIFNARIEAQQSQIDDLSRANEDLARRLERLESRDVK